MIILIDIGHTRVKWATLVEGIFTFIDAVSYDAKTLPQVLSQRLQILPPCQQVLIANVAGAAVKEQLDTWAAQQPHLTVTYAQTEAQRGDLQNAYPDPSTLGIDRWAAMVAARQQYPHQPIILFNAGTCLTVDAIQASGQHLGGYLVPGMALMRTALLGHTSLGERSTHNAKTPAACTFARTTQTGIDNGSLQMTVSFIHTLTEHFRSTEGPHSIALFTGGSAPTLLTHLTGDYQYVPYLVLQGLAAMTS